MVGKPMIDGGQSGDSPHVLLGFCSSPALPFLSSPTALGKTCGLSFKLRSSSLSMATMRTAVRRTRLRPCPIAPLSRAGSTNAPYKSKMGPTASTPPPRSTTLTIPDSPEPSTSAAASASGSATEAPPYLPRPLGVSDPPRTTPLTVQEKKARLLDEGARKAERKHLCVLA